MHNLLSIIHKALCYFYTFLQKHYFSCFWRKGKLEISLAIVLVFSLTLENVYSASSEKKEQTLLQSSQVTLKLPYLAYTLTTPEGQSHSLWLQLPVTEEQSRVGLMFRHRMKQNTGMLFRFPQPRYTLFWMKHCFIPLDFVYGYEDTVVATTENLAACPSGKNCPVYESPSAVTWLLELPAGSVKGLGIVPGSTLLPTSRSAKTAL